MKGEEGEGVRGRVRRVNRAWWDVEATEGRTRSDGCGHQRSGLISVSGARG